MKKSSSGRNMNANLEMMPIWKCCPIFIRSCSTHAKIQALLGRTPPKTHKKNALLACLAQRLSAFTSRCGTDTAGRGALGPLLEDGARTKLFDREFSPENRILGPRRKNTPPKKRMIAVFVTTGTHHTSLKYQGQKIKLPIQVYTYYVRNTRDRSITHIRLQK